MTDKLHRHAEAALERLRRVKTFILDLDGTFYLGDRILPGSLRLAARLEALGKEFVFVTNNSSRQGRYYADKITRLGLPVQAGQVFTSGEATIRYLRRIGCPRGIWVAGTPDLEEEFRAAGFEPNSTHPAMAVLGFDLGFTYDKLSRLCALVRGGTPFIATHPDLNCPTSGGPVPDCGALAAAVTAATGVRPKVIGKPFPEMVEAIRDKYGLERDNVAIAGDRLYTDIAMGRAAGILAILVLSGETRPGDLDGSPHQPDLTLADLGELADLLA
ncbi:MAG: HAD-IIA family hydrolase [Patescibacteria group bacterium]